MSGRDWQFSNVWNDSLLRREERAIEPRDYIWASELGGSYIDRYLKMTGVKPTNPPNARSLRKFQAGNLWEWIVSFTLKRAGLLIDQQEKIKFQYEGLLEVSGKQDFIAGGRPNWDLARQDMNTYDLPDTIKSISLSIIDDLEFKYGYEPLKEIVLEVKSMSSVMFQYLERIDRPLDNHRLQIYHYLKGKNMQEGHMVYIDKDSCLLKEYPVYLNSEVEHYYRADIEQMTKYLRGGERPPLDAEVIFDDATCKFKKNSKVEYSNYLTMLYKYEMPMDYDNRWRKSIAGWNRVLKRIVDGANMTKGNLEAVAEAKKVFANFDELVEKAKKVGVIEDEENED